MASTRPPGTYSPSARTGKAWRRVWKCGRHGPARGGSDVLSLRLNRPGGQVRRPVSAAGPASSDLLTAVVDQGLEGVDATGGRPDSHHRPGSPSSARASTAADVNSEKRQ